jgi:DNA-directed RNA polymerase subunit M/transcription elongation factor TFIIS
MVKAYNFSCMGGNVAIPRLEICPKCKGHLMLEKDNYGLYQQCLQCGYLHDLQTFPVIDSAKIEDEKESVGSHRVTAMGSRDISQNTPPLFESSRSTALANALDFQLILDALHKRQQDKTQ